MDALIAVLIALAVLAGRGPGGRPVAAVVRGRRPGVGPGSGVVQLGAPVRGAAASGPGRVAGAWARVRRRGGPPDRSRDLAVVVVEVASQLRAGADPGQAWGRALGRPVGHDGVPHLEDLLGEGTGAEAAAVVAAGALAGALGAPLAQVLDRVASGLAVAAEIDGERRAALAGPRATAWVLTVLPALGVVLGAAVGADPVRVLLGGGVGTGALVLGVALLVVGRTWIAWLVRRAARAGRPS